VLAKLVRQTDIGAEEIEAAFGEILAGRASDIEAAGFAVALRTKGETVTELAAMVRTMLRYATTIDVPDGAIDTCGTGGDNSGTFNVSTATALVVAGSGIPVAKHGNRNLSSKCGSADILAALGVNIDADMALVKRSLWEAGMCFLMAPRHHSAMRHVGPTRVELGTRTIFNLLGPLSNPAGAERQLVGVFAPQWLRPMAEVLGKLGSKRAWVVHGSGLDELTTTGASQVASLENGKVTSFEVTPEEVGLRRVTVAELKGGDPADNAATMRALLGGATGAIRDIVLLNTGAGLHVAGKARDLSEGITLAARTIDSGTARQALDKMIAITNEKPAV